jgi:hypothetical protein
VFADPRARVSDDPDHSDDEPRFLLVGVSYAASLSWCTWSAANDCESSRRARQRGANARSSRKGSEQCERNMTSRVAVRIRMPNG